MKASELIKALSQMIEKYGDLEVYSMADWEYVTDVEHDTEYGEARLTLYGEPWLPGEASQ